jgi:hypothetical protein
VASGVIRNRDPGALRRFDYSSAGSGELGVPKAAPGSFIDVAGTIKEPFVFR